MIDICFNDFFVSTFKSVEKLCDNIDTIELPLHFHIGSLCDDPIINHEQYNADVLMLDFPNITRDEVEHSYNTGLYWLQLQIEKLEQHLQKEQDIRVWIENTAQDRCNLYWLCNLAKLYTAKVFIVELNAQKERYIETTQWDHSHDLTYVTALAGRALLLTTSEKEHLAEKWNSLVVSNAPLRVLIDDNLLSVPEDFFDNIILQQLDTPPISQANILRKVFDKGIKIDAGFFSKRINTLILEGKLSVFEEKLDAYGCCWPRTITIV